MLTGCPTLGHRCINWRQFIRKHQTSPILISKFQRLTWGKNKGIFEKGRNSYEVLIGILAFALLYHDTYRIVRYLAIHKIRINIMSKYFVFGREIGRRKLIHVRVGLILFWGNKFLNNLSTKLKSICNRVISHWSMEVEGFIVRRKKYL